jgi:hypothetical protein
MSLTDSDRRRIISELEGVEAAVLRLIMATFQAFVDWLVSRLPDIYRRVGDALKKLWKSIRAAFA